LLAFGVGRLPDDALEPIAAHLEGCTSCRALLGELDGHADPLLEELRGPLPAGLFSGSAGTLGPGEARRDAGVPGATGAGGARGPPATRGGGGLPAVPGYELLGVLGRGGMDVVRPPTIEGLLTCQRKMDGPLVQHAGS